MYKPAIKILVIGFLLGFAACKKDNSSSISTNSSTPGNNNNTPSYSFSATLNGVQTTGTALIAAKTTTSGITVAGFDGKLTYENTDYQVVMSVTGYKGIGIYKDGDSTAVQFIMVPASGSNVHNPAYEYSGGFKATTISVTKVDSISVAGTFSSKIYNNTVGVAGPITDSVTVTDGKFILQWK